MTEEPFKNLIIPLQDRHTDYLRDESRFSGRAESISFPRNEAQIRAIVKTVSKQQIPITVQGSRTGITGGAVPTRGHIMNLSKMDQVTGMEQDQTGSFSIRVQPGILLSDLDQRLNDRRFDTELWNREALFALAAFKKSGRYFWPPDPSEASASVGGIAAGNSRGICAHLYGPARNHIRGIRVIDGNGQVLSITRGEYLFSKDRWPLPDGGTLKLDAGIPDPGSLKDLMDLYLGSQGMVGVITELTLSLQPLPGELWGIVFFFPDQAGAVAFIQAIQERKKSETSTDIAAIEFMDHTSLAMIHTFKQATGQLKRIPDWDTHADASVYIEIHGNQPEETDGLSQWLIDKSSECGSDPDAGWAFCGKSEIKQARAFRHAAPEAVNRLIDKARLTDTRILKLGTDMRLETADLAELIKLYQTDLSAAGLTAAIFGHAADGHLHVNILPDDYDQFNQGRRLIETWAEKVHAKGGCAVTEHGIGKIKTDLFRSIPLPRHLKIICCLKQQLDPQRIWNPGNMTDLTEQ